MRGGAVLIYTGSSICSPRKLVVAWGFRPTFEIGPLLQRLIVYFDYRYFGFESEMNQELSRLVPHIFAS